MARPKHIEGNAGAKEALVEAFWRMLRQQPYSKITVKALSTEAKVNHNTFYYHFQDMEHLAEYAFDQAFPKDTVTDILSKLIKDDAQQAELPYKEFEPAFQRIKLFARPDSPELNTIVKNRVESLWLEVMGLKRESLSNSRRAMLSFLMAGGLAVVGGNEEFSLSDFQEMINGPVGKSARAIIRSLVN